MKLSVERTLLLFVGGGILCLSCCLIFPLPETVLYDLPDSLNDLQSMKRSTSDENVDDLCSSTGLQHKIDANIVSVNRCARPQVPAMFDMNDLSGSTVVPTTNKEIATPKTILRSQHTHMGTGSTGKTVTIHSQPEIIHLDRKSVV